MGAKAEMYKGTVKAKTRGYAGGEIREPGEVFYFEGPLGSWMEKVEESKPAPAPKAAA